MTPGRLVVHLDMDSFYVSVERLRDPSLIGKPVAAGGSADGRGVVSSASYEARAFGVRSAMPMAQALRLCPHLIVVSSPFSLYAEYSQQIATILRRFTPLVQMASQDEAYLDLTGTGRLWGPPLVCAGRIRAAIVQETGLPCSLGVATNKVVAKVASALCKPRGLLYIPEGSEEPSFRPLPVGRLPGIGPRTRERLGELGLSTLGQLADYGPERLQRLFGSHGEDMARLARGISHAPVEPETDAKSIGAEETFAQDETDPLFLDGILSNLAEKVAWRLRRGGALAATVVLKLRYHDFETHTVSRTVESPIDDEAELLRVARELLHQSWVRTRPVRLLGITGSNLVRGRQQLDLLQSGTNERLDRLHKAIDSVRERHGYEKLKRGSSGGRGEEKNERHWG